MEGEVKRDALGNAVMFGKNYGFALDNNGIMKVVLGKALKATKQGVTLEVISSKIAVYGGELKDQTDAAKKVNVKSGKLFPVNI